ncbi:MAG: hypothetical protein A4E62_00626 [Syntrophorhabdus sp. PtaU1.Bin002]|nr:MAG: hypothetical protein A4E58_02702 [Syntrophorhabdus sp. PtaB.Bin006]OPY73119.1 MAG: hypothetical protein A4E62_00626 [Syntrophorhabdus sp. PtaU1.Bin002]
MKKYVTLLFLAVLFHLSGYYVLIKKVEPFQYFFYLIAWWSYVVIIDTLFAVRTKKFAVLNRGLPSIVIISSGFWCIFELINLRLENWFYINLPENMLERWAGYLFAYGTVLPAIYGTKKLIHSFLGEVHSTPVLLQDYPRYALLIGTAAFLLALVFPLYFFPFAWIAPALVLDSHNYRKGNPSFMRDLERGMTGDLVAALLSGLVCGLLWELWNFWSISKWVYTVPFFEDIKLFEMPFAGYLGFPAFAVTVIAFTNFLPTVRLNRIHSLVAIIVALALSFCSFTLIDRYTVFSYTPRVDTLSFMPQARVDLLKTKGTQRSYGIDIGTLNEEERQALALIHLKGLGYENFLRLKGHGIMTVEGLAQCNEKTLSQILDEPNLRRIRVYLKAARKARDRAFSFIR